MCYIKQPRAIKKNHYIWQNEIFLAASAIYAIDQNAGIY